MKLHFAAYYLAVAFGLPHLAYSEHAEAHQDEVQESQPWQGSAKTMQLRRSLMMVANDGESEMVANDGEIKDSIPEQVEMDDILGGVIMDGLNLFWRPTKTPCIQLTFVLMTSAYPNPDSFHRIRSVQQAVNRSLLSSILTSVQGTKWEHPSSLLL